MKLNITKEDRIQILEMHLREKRGATLSEQQINNPYYKQLYDYLLNSPCFKDDKNTFNLAALKDPPKPEHEWVIQSTNNQTKNIKYLTIDGYVYTPPDNSKPQDNLQITDRWSTANCTKGVIQSERNALRDFYVKHLYAKTIQELAANGVSILDVKNDYRELRELGEPLLFVDKRIPRQSSYAANSPATKQISDIRKKNGKFEHELTPYERQRWQKLVMKPNADFPEGFVYYLPYPGGYEENLNNPTSADNAWASGASSAAAGGASAGEEETVDTGEPNLPPTYQEMYNSIRNQRRLTPTQLNECAGILRNWYNDWTENARERYSDDEFTQIKTVAQFCVYQLDPSKFSSIFGQKGGAIDRDTKKIIKIMTGEGSPQISQRDPFFLRKNRTR